MIFEGVVLDTQAKGSALVEKMMIITRETQTKTHTILQRIKRTFDF